MDWVRAKVVQRIDKEAARLRDDDGVCRWCQYVNKSRLKISNIQTALMRFFMRDIHENVCSLRNEVHLKIRIKFFIVGNLRN